MKEHLLITRYDVARVKKGDMMSVDDVREMLGIELLGIVPESQSVLKASNTGVPVSLDNVSAAGRAYRDAVARFLGENIEHRIYEDSRSGLFSRMFGRGG